MIRHPGADNTQKPAGDDIERMVACVHDTRDGDESRGKDGNHDDESLPSLAAVIHDMELATQPKREVEQTREGSYQQVSVTHNRQNIRVPD